MSEITTSEITTDTTEAEAEKSAVALSCLAIVPAAGRGVRFGDSENKIFAPLQGRPLIGWTLEALAKSPSIQAIVLVGGAEELDRLREVGQQYGGGKVRAVVEGGADRQSSVRNGIAAAEGQEWILVHDGARPCITPALIEATILAATRGNAATLALPVVETLIQAEGVTGAGAASFAGSAIPRDNVWSMQTPQAFSAALLEVAHEAARRANFAGTDDAGLVRRMGGRIALVPGSSENIKVTRPEDLTLAAAILAWRNPPAPATLPIEVPNVPTEEANTNHVQARESDFAGLDAPFSGENAANGEQETPPLRFSGEDENGESGDAEPIRVPSRKVRRVPFRTGHGYDVHPFADGRPLWLGGVLFPYSPRGLMGHSDADALLHAVCDALLGAAGLGDIGRLFPPTDKAHKDRASIEFLREVQVLLVEDGWRVGNVDVTVLAETPKIAPRAGEIKAVIAEVLGISPFDVSIKATTNEGMGFVGRSEGIAVHATALLMATTF